jgi:hypothetical protein
MVIKPSSSNPIKSTETNSQSSDDFKEPNLKYNLSKFEYDLYHEEDDVAEKIIRVKRFAVSNDEKWKIFEDSKVTLIIEGAKLSKKEKEFLRTVDGVNFLLSQYKSGINSFNSMKIEIKKKLSDLDK